MSLEQVADALGAPTFLLSACQRPDENNGAPRQRPGPSRRLAVQASGSSSSASSMACSSVKAVPAPTPPRRRLPRGRPRAGLCSVVGHPLGGVEGDAGALAQPHAASSSPARGPAPPGRPARRPARRGPGRRTRSGPSGAAGSRPSANTPRRPLRVALLERQVAQPAEGDPRTPRCPAPRATPGGQGARIRRGALGRSAAASCADHASGVGLIVVSPARPQQGGRSRRRAARASPGRPLPRCGRRPGGSGGLGPTRLRGAEEPPASSAARPRSPGRPLGG